MLKKVKKYRPLRLVLLDIFLVGFLACVLFRHIEFLLVFYLDIFLPVFYLDIYETQQQKREENLASE